MELFRCVPELLFANDAEGEVVVEGEVETELLRSNCVGRAVGEIDVMIDPDETDVAELLLLLLLLELLLLANRLLVDILLVLSGLNCYQ